MLTRRTNLLLSEEDYQMLSDLSRKSGKTMGEIIRNAIKKTHKLKTNSRKKTLANIASLSKKANTKNIDYKKLVNYGRKY